MVSPSCVLLECFFCYYCMLCALVIHHGMFLFSVCFFFFVVFLFFFFFFFSSRRRHTRCLSDRSSDVCSSDLGDPASALLEVLDPEQNFSFQDHYLDVPFDLRRVMFVTTANVLDTIPPPLRDRMEVIELAGYTEEEKLEIARRHLIPKQLAEHGLTAENLTFEDEALVHIIRAYTREAGLRTLEREIGRVRRKVARAITEGRTEPVVCTVAKVHEYLGPEKFFAEIAERTEQPGVAVGLAWTPNGGDILFIESTRMSG